jgi:hypothetical protein
LVAYGVYGQPALDDAVITVNGFCGHTVAQTDTCRTVITRAQFEQLTRALDPNMPADLRLKVAGAYARMMRMAAVAEERGLDQTENFAEEMRYARLQLLSRDLDRTLRQDVENISDADVEAYFRENHSSFEQATLARIFVPRLRRGDGDSAAEMLRVAADLRVRAVHGADPDELERQAYTAAGISGSVPRTSLENVRRDTLPPSHEMAMDLAPGEVSEVLSDPDGGHFIYKMVSRRQLSLLEVQVDIRKELAERRYRQAIQRFSGDVVLDDSYFASYATPHRPRRERRRGHSTSAQ